MRQDNYFENHPWYTSNFEILHAKMYSKYISDLKKQWITLKSSDSILEIWVWIWNFTHYCNQNNIKKYIWLDIDKYFFDDLRKNYPYFSFINEKYQNFLEGKKETFDIIFTSHICEHLSQSEIIDLTKFIYNSLKKGWIWINYMPNANAVINASYMRYGDITHRTLYNSDSFEQIINISKVRFNEIKHLNDNPTNLIKKIIHNIFVLITKIYFMWMMQSFPKNYTSNLISILKK